MEKENKKLNYRVLTVFGAFLLLILFLTFTKSYILGSAAEIDKTQVKSKTSSVEVTHSKNSPAKLNFQAINFDISSIIEDQVIKDLPKSASIELKLGETSYSISKDSVSLGKPANPDITIHIPEQYASQLSSGLCETIKKANADKNLAIEAHASQTSLLWKYSGMLKYKSCLG